LFFLPAVALAEAGLKHTACGRNIFWKKAYYSKKNKIDIHHVIELKPCGINGVLRRNSTG
jgi:hypothetical protein